MRFPMERLELRIGEVGQHIFRAAIPQESWRLLPAAEATKTVPPADAPAWQTIRLGDWWGADDQQAWAWFRREVEIPDGWDGRRAALLVRLGELQRAEYPEALAYIDGVPRQGVDRWHYLVELSEHARSGTRYDIAMEAWRGRNYSAERFQQADLVWIDDETKDFYFDAMVALEVAQSLPEDDYARVHLINALESAFLVVDFREPIGDAFYASVRKARETLRSAIDGVPLHPRHERVRAVGHAHIDVAWLWPLAQTRQKVARTFSTALRLMERYPEYHFLQSQAQLYQYLQQDYPEMLDEIRERVREGRWEVNGGTWVEMDTNVPSGESLVRQFLLGRRLFKDLFGKDGDILWLPDVFGYSGALPQIIKRAGLAYFMTTKISWSQYNRFPYDTFYWKGIDGTRVLTHFATTPSGAWFYTYNGDLRPAAVLGTWSQHSGKEITDEVLMSYGWGDGGGGPTLEMLENGRRLAEFPGAPRVVMGSANDFFRGLEERVEDSLANGVHVPEWDGELYLEYHRGTLTSQAQNKRSNRKSEVLLHQAEALASMASLTGAPYPTKELQQGWELVLLNQFHDILPGSSIRSVYEDCAKDYARIEALGTTARNAAMRAIAARVRGARPGDIVVFNTLGSDRTDLVQLERPDNQRALVDVETGAAVPLQPLDEGDASHCLVLARDVPAYGYRVYRWQAEAASPPVPGASLTVRADGLETPYLRIVLDEQGHLVSCYDKRTDREALAAEQRSNVLQVFEDKPLRHDAWDIDIFYLDKMWEIDNLESARVVEQGPLRVCVEQRRRFRQSTVVQRLYAYAHTPRLDFETEVDWRERHLLLKAAFPVKVHSPRATYEIQFGSLERPTHWNTSWDYARFEVCGHRWADLSEGDYGVSLLNDCKYGHDTKGNVLRLTLIKSATAPDPEADQGSHHFTYSLLPHPGDWRCGTLGQAAALNDPLLHTTVPGNAPATNAALPTTMSLVACDAEHVVIDTVKAAENGDGVIVRVYEAYNQRGPVRLSFGPRVLEVWECNLMEENEKGISTEPSGFRFEIKPYQIRSFRVRLEPTA